MVAAAILYGSPVWAQGTLTGVVMEPAGNSIGGARVSVTGTTIGVFTNGLGRYTLANMPPGAHEVAAARIGYPPVSQIVTVNPGQTVTLNFVLAPATPPTRFITAATVSPLIPDDSVHLPAPAIAIVRSRQATPIAVVPELGETFQLPLFDDVVLTVQTQSVRKDERGTHVVGRIVGRANGLGNVVAVINSHGITANVRDGLTVFLIRPQPLNVELIVEVDQTKLPPDGNDGSAAR